MKHFEEKQAESAKLICKGCGGAGECHCAGNAEPKLGEQVAISQYTESNESSLEEELGERFKLLSHVGTGGMGSVFKVEERSSGKTFAIKILNQSLLEDASSLKRFELEAKSARSVVHPNLVAVYDYGITGKGRPFLVMDYLDGSDLKTLLAKEGFLDVARALNLFIQCAEGLAHAHQLDIIHRDVKPSNIILESRDSGIEFAKIVDFGIAKILPNQQTITDNLTVTGDIFGTPIYMSPEQCQGNCQDQRSDIYSLGCVMYEVLTGERPFAASNSVKTILRHINDDAASMNSLNYGYGIPKDLDYIVMRCLQKDPADRYQTSHELLKDLHSVSSGEAIRRKTCIGKEQKSKQQSRKLEFERFLAIVLVLQVVPLLMAYLLTPGYIVPIFRSPAGLLLLFAIYAWEALGFSLFYLRPRPRSEFETTLQSLIFGILFLLPGCTLPLLAPAIITVMQAIGPIMNSVH